MGKPHTIHETHCYTWAGYTSGLNVSMCVSYYIHQHPHTQPLRPLTSRNPHTHDSLKYPEPHTHSVIHTPSVTLPPSQPHSQDISLFTQKAIYLTTEQAPHISLKVAHNEQHKEFMLYYLSPPTEILNQTDNFWFKLLQWLLLHILA